MSNLIFKGTPAPWRVRKLSDETIFVESPKELINRTYGQEIMADDYHNTDWKQYDAALIAAAPELLTELQKLVDLCTGWPGIKQSDLQPAKYVLLKALNHESDNKS